MTQRGLGLLGWLPADKHYVYTRTSVQIAGVYCVPPELGRLGHSLWNISDNRVLLTPVSSPIPILSQQFLPVGDRPHNAAPRIYGDGVATLDLATAYVAVKEVRMKPFWGTLPGDDQAHAHIDPASKLFFCGRYRPKVHEDAPRSLTPCRACSEFPYQEIGRVVARDLKKQYNQRLSEQAVEHREQQRDRRRGLGEVDEEEELQT